MFGQKGTDIFEFILVISVDGVWFFRKGVNNGNFLLFHTLFRIDSSDFFYIRIFFLLSQKCVSLFSLEILLSQSFFICILKKNVSKGIAGHIYIGNSIFRNIWVKLSLEIKFYFLKRLNFGRNTGKDVVLGVQGRLYWLINIGYNTLVAIGNSYIKFISSLLVLFFFKFI